MPGGLDPAGPLVPLVLFGTLWVVLQEQPEGGVTEQKGLGEPQAAGARTGDPFVAVGRNGRQTFDRVLTAVAFSQIITWLHGGLYRTFSTVLCSVGHSNV